MAAAARACAIDETACPATTAATADSSATGATCSRATRATARRLRLRAVVALDGQDAAALAHGDEPPREERDVERPVPLVDARDAVAGPHLSY